jgi:peptidoglycan/xylan/chitin deacetylase (PgdA/CDA1 family)
MNIWKSSLLHLYYYGSLPYRQWANRRAAAKGRAPVLVFFYHRVADDEANPWTVSNRTFARQIAWLRPRVDLVSLGEAQRRIAAADNPRVCASITFDDGYAANLEEAIPLLVRERIPCTYFVTLHNVLSGEPFAHDAGRDARFAPNTIGQLRALALAGIEIGAHGYHHADLGRAAPRRQLHREIAVAGRELQELLGRPVRYFAFPFGQRANLSQAALAVAQAAGYEAACSAYGAYNFPGDDAFHIQRIAADASTIRLKNWATVDPRKTRIVRFAWKRDEGRGARDEGSGFGVSGSEPGRVGPAGIETEPAPRDELLASSLDRQE